MTRSSRLTILAGLVLLGACTPTASSGSETKAAASADAANADAAPAPLPSVELPDDLQRVLTDYEEAWGARDADALARLFAENGFVLSRGRPPIRGRDAIRAHYEGKGGPLALRALEFRAEGDVAFIIGGYSGERGAPDDGKFTLTMVREGDRWSIMSDMDNSNRR